MGLDVNEAQFGQVDRVYECVNTSRHIVTGDQIVQRSVKETELLTVLSGAVAHVIFIGSDLPPFSGPF